MEKETCRHCIHWVICKFNVEYHYVMEDDFVDEANHQPASDELFELMAKWCRFYKVI